MKRFSNIAFSLVCLVGFELSGLAQSSTITTYAGIGHWPVSGTQAITQPIGSPVSVIPDAFGGFYFAGSDQPRVYRVTADGTVTVIAGIGTAGFSGDGGPALSAQLMSLSDVALDAAGNVFIADFGNSRIRKVSLDGVISTVAGSGTVSVAGETFGGDGGPATAALLNYPWGVAVDGVGNLFNRRHLERPLRKVSPNGLITTVAGVGTFGGDLGPASSAQLNFPTCVATPRWMGRAICSSPTPATTASARSRQTVSLVRWRAPV